MALPPDLASLILLEIGKELQFYEDSLAMIGLLYVGKVTVSLSLSLYRGFREHIFTKLYPNKELIPTYGPWAVVTGASEGIGRAFAEELAKRGLNIVLLDIELEKLNEVSAEIEQETGVDTRIVEVDFYDEITENKQLEDVLQNVDAGILVNSFQMMMPTPQRFASQSIEEMCSLLNSNIIWPTYITHVALDGMLKRKRGLILNVSAFSGLYPVPYISAYSSSKAYMECFSKCLSMELTNTDVEVQTVTPGLVRAEDSPNDDTLSYLLPTTSNFVRNTVDSLGVSQRITGSWIFSVQLWFLKRLPEFLLRRLVCEIMSSAAR